MATAAAPERNPLFRALPAVFSRPDWAMPPEAADTGSGYVAALLDAFSGMFLAKEPQASLPSLTQRILSLPAVPDPAGKSPEFLDWLGAWVALSTRIGLPHLKKRKLIANAIRLYGIRGTKRYLEEMLGYYLSCGATVDEPDLPSVQIGRSSTVGRDCYIGGSPAHFFRVTLLAGASARDEEFAHLLLQARAVIDLSKPAHTWYELRISAPAMQIGTHSTVGVDTLLMEPVAGGEQ
jgi:phage tail-like protein